MGNEEIFPIVDLQGNVTGKATRRECHSGSMLLHPVVHLHVFDTDGNIYLQKRSLNKDIQPGKWDTAVGGHVDYGETVECALRRESREELGLEHIEPAHLVTYDFTSDREHELVNVFCITVNRETFNPHIDPVEIDEGRFWSNEEVEAAISCGILTPNFEQEYMRIKSLIAICPK
ncbi:MAG: NUDIX domain-containing protein [Bacteroides sp.]|nr:NUDIX domain-containing protein [Bacteroides sp.]